MPYLLETQDFASLLPRFGVNASLLPRFGVNASLIINPQGIAVEIKKIE